MVVVVTLSGPAGGADHGYSDRIQIPQLRHSMPAHTATVEACIPSLPTVNTGPGRVR
jgi:hypothetical protein